MKNERPHTTIRCHIQVPFEFPVVFTEHVFDLDNRVLTDVVAAESARLPAKCLVMLDSGLAEADDHLIGNVNAYFNAHADMLTLATEPIVLPGGEDAKNSFEVALKAIRFARQVHVCRQSYLVAIGGGAFLDAVGFAASLTHRGVRLIRIPTTVLAQNDSGVGVKNGVNLRGAKNFLGTFAPPAAVLNDVHFLTTLDHRDWIAGVAEAYKVAIIKDAEFLAWLKAAETLITHRNLQTMALLINRCARIHLDHIMNSGDPFEFGSARPLDFGHWAAHKLESLTINELRHGEAVAVGIALDLLYAVKIGLLEEKMAMGVIRSMVQVGLPVWHDALRICDDAGYPLVLHGIEEFREHLGGELHVTLPGPVGQSVEVQQLDRKLICSCIDQLAGIAVPS